MMLQKSENAVITRKGDLKKRLIRYKWMYPMLLPGLIILFVFSYMPLYGLLMAFQDFDIVSGISGSPWVGLDNFRQIFDSAIVLKELSENTGLWTGYESIIKKYQTEIFYAIY